GGIEAMVSYPGFDPALFVKGMSNNEFERRFGEAKGSPLTNRAIQGEYAPGSTFKPFIALAAMNQETVDTNGRTTNREIASTDDFYGCPASWTVPYNQDNPDAIQYVFN